MDNKKLTREEAEVIANEIFDAGFFVGGYGHFDISRKEFVTMLMIALNHDNSELCLKRYYWTLHNQEMGKARYGWYTEEEKVKMRWEEYIRNKQ